MWRKPQVRPHFGETAKPPGSVQTKICSAVRGRADPPRGGCWGGVSAGQRLAGGSAFAQVGAHFGPPANFRPAFDQVFDLGPAFDQVFDPCASARDLGAWHALHRVRRLSSVSAPPRDRGCMWSAWSSPVLGCAWRPHCWQVQLSRRNVACCRRCGTLRPWWLPQRCVVCWGHVPVVVSVVQLGCRQTLGARGIRLVGCQWSRCLVRRVAMRRVLVVVVGCRFWLR